MDCKGRGKRGIKNGQIKLDTLTTRIFIGLLCVKLVGFEKFVKLVKPDNRYKYQGVKD